MYVFAVICEAVGGILVLLLVVYAVVAVGTHAYYRTRAKHILEKE
jgi:hypothetical protein